MEDRRIIKLLFARAESAIDVLAGKFGRRLMSIAIVTTRNGNQLWRNGYRKVVFDVTRSFQNAFCRVIIPELPSDLPQGS